MSKTVFTVNFEDSKKIEEAIKNFEGNAEKTINDYLRNEGKNILIDEITQKIPISKRGKSHAKTHKWYTMEFYNLAIKISTANKYYYLRFVNDGTGTSKKGTHLNFFENAGEKASKKISEGLINRLNEEFKIER